MPPSGRNAPLAAQEVGQGSTPRVLRGVGLGEVGRSLSCPGGCATVGGEAHCWRFSGGSRTLASQEDGGAWRATAELRGLGCASGRLHGGDERTSETGHLVVMAFELWAGRALGTQSAASPAELLCGSLEDTNVSS